MYLSCRKFDDARKWQIVSFCVFMCLKDFYPSSPLQDPGDLHLTLFLSIQLFWILSGDGRPGTRSSRSPGAARGPLGRCRSALSLAPASFLRTAARRSSRAGRTLQPPGVTLPPRPLPSRLSFFPFGFGWLFLFEWDVFGANKVSRGK